jgi:hypothetical protein
METRAIGCESKELDANYLTGSFAVSFWLNIDVHAVTINGADLTLFTFSDSKDTSLSVYLSHSHLRARYVSLTRRIYLQVTGQPLPLDYVPVVINFTHCPAHRCMVVSSWVNDLQERDGDFCLMEFADPVTVRLGCCQIEGSRVNCEFGFLGDFRFFNHPLDLRERQSLGYTGEPPSDVDLRFESPFRKRCLCDSCLLDQLILKYQEFQVLPLLSVVGSLNLAALTPTVLIRILSSAQVDSASYFCVYSFFENVECRSEWFERVILNFQLWRVCDQNSLARILSHWCDVVISDCRAELEEKLYFSHLLAVFDPVFPASDTHTGGCRV